MRRSSAPIDFFSPQSHPQPTELPLAQEGLACGFPSPASGYLEEGLDLNQLVVRDRATTFFGRVSGDSMCDAGILDGDLLVIDRGLKGQNGDVALCMLNGEFTVKRLLFRGEQILLQPENSGYSSIVVTPESDFQIWGVVTYSFRPLRRRRE